MSATRHRLIALYALLIAFNIAAWVWTFCVFRSHPLMLGTALLAYGLGLRHAVDADHIAAIDNVTRKLVQQGSRPIGVGVCFSLGHSAVIVLAALVVALTTTGLTSWFAQWKAAGALISTTISVLFLFAIAAINLVVLLDILRAFRNVRRGQRMHEQELDLLLNGRGLLARLLRPLLRLVSRSWHMLPLGFVFGLGFDTATEVAMLGISATQANEGMSIWSIMVFPALFTAAMSLIDTTDGVLMVGAYNWALVRPLRKLYYNLIITGASVAIALLVGGIEALRLIGDRLGLEGGFWRGIGALNDEFSVLGFAIIGVFILAWLTSLIVYRYARPGEAARLPASR